MKPHHKLVEEQYTKFINSNRTTIATTTKIKNKQQAVTHEANCDTQLH